MLPSDIGAAERGAAGGCDQLKVAARLSVSIGLVVSLSVMYASA